MRYNVLNQLMRFILLTVLALVLIGFATAGSCENQGGQYRQMGEKLGEMSAEGTVPGSMKYVANMKTMEYWPNLSQYASAIPSEYRFYIRDDETLEQFKEYKPGPL